MTCVMIAMIVRRHLHRVARMLQLVRNALHIEAHTTAEIPEDLRARILANLPSADEIAAGRWGDEA